MEANDATNSAGYQEYPKYKYQGTQGTLVANKAEEDALGEGYTATPTEDVVLPAADPRDARIAELEAELAEARAKAKAKGVKAEG